MMANALKRRATRALRAARWRQEEADEHRRCAAWYRRIAEDYAAAHRARESLRATAEVTAERIELLRLRAEALQIAENFDHEAARLAYGAAVAGAFPAYWSEDAT